MNILTEIVGKDLTTLRKPDMYNWNKSNTEGIQPGECYFNSPLLSYGDYDNSCAVERSNVRLFLEEFKDHKDVIVWHGGYGSTCILIDVLCEDEEIIEVLKSLENYPCINDEDVSMLEMEMEQEDWENWIKRDFLNAIEKHYKADSSEITDEELSNLYYRLKEETNTEYIVESGGNGYIDIDRLIKGLPEEAPTELNLEYW